MKAGWSMGVWRSGALALLVACSELGMQAPGPMPWAAAVIGETDTAAEETDGPPSSSGETDSPPGETDVLPDETEGPPGETDGPPGETDSAPGDSDVPPGDSDVPPGDSDVPPGDSGVPPGDSDVPPGDSDIVVDGDDTATVVLPPPSDFNDADGDGVDDDFRVGGGGCNASGLGATPFLVWIAALALRRSRAAPMLAAMAWESSAFALDESVAATEVEGGFSVERYVTPLDPSGILDAEGASTGTGRGSAVMWYGVSRQPLRLFEMDNGDRVGTGALIEGRTGFLTGGSLRLGEAFELAAQLPLVLRQARALGTLSSFGGFSTELASDAALGDARLAIKARVIGRADGRFALALVASGTLPTGDLAAFAGEAGPVLEPLLAATVRSGDSQWNFNAGYRWRRSPSGTAIEASSELLYRLAYERQTPWKVRAQLGVSGGTALAVDAASGHPVEVLGGATLPMGPVSFGLGFGVGTYSGFGNPVARGFATLRASAPVREKPLPMPDLVPIVAPVVVAGDEQKGPAVPVAPAPDGPGTVRWLAEADAVKSVEALDRKLREVLFEVNSAMVLPESANALDQAARMLNRPDFLRYSVEVQGHTDSTGRREWNLKLSQMRAQSVAEALIKRGVRVERLTAVGYGPDSPIASNATPEGRLANRRVMLRVLLGDTSKPAK